nr:hypothetical protein [Nocardia africana]
MFDDLPVLEPPDIHDGDIGLIACGGHAVMQDHVVVLGDDPHEFEIGAGDRGGGDELDEIVSAAGISVLVVSMRRLLPRDAGRVDCMSCNGGGR